MEGENVVGHSLRFGHGVKNFPAILFEDCDPRVEKGLWAQEPRAVRGDFLVVDAVPANRSPSADFLVTRKDQVNLSESAPRGRKPCYLFILNQWFV